MTNSVNIRNSILNDFLKTEKDKEALPRAVWDPKKNLHCFNKGFGRAWYDKGGNTLQNRFITDPMEMLRATKLDFTPKMGQAGTIIDGEFVPTTPATYNIVRGDDPTITLQVGVGGNYNLKPYSEIVKIPDSVEISPGDFDPKSGVMDFLQSQHPEVDLGNLDLKIPVNQILLPAGCSSWQDGRKITFQYFIGEMEPAPGDKHHLFLNIESALDGTKTTRYYLTMVRVVCENTQLHAEQQGWNNLADAEKLRQRIRRTGRMDEKIVFWHENISNVLVGAVQTMNLFKTLASRKIADSETRRKKIVEEFVTEIFNLDAKGTGKGATQKNNLKEQILKFAIFESNWGGDKCETFYDLWNGITSWNSRWARVNGLENDNERDERRYFLQLTSDIQQKELNNQFVSLLQLAEKVA